MADEPRGLPVPQARPGAAQNVGVAVAQIPGRLTGGTAVKVTPDGLNYSVSLDISELGEAPATDLAKTWVPAWVDDSAGQTYRVTLATLSISLPIPWDNITGKPATFPPTLPIPSSGVTGLDNALAAIALDLTGLDTRLDTAESTIATHTSEISALDGRADALESKLADGDKGDIVVSGGGTVWTIDAVYTAQWMPKTGGVFTGNVYIENAYAELRLKDTIAAAGVKQFSIFSSAGYLHLSRLDDAGNWLSSPVTVNHATEVVGFSVRPVFGAYTPYDTGNLGPFTGDSGVGGALGLVPAPGAGDAAAGKVLGAGGGWVDPAGLPAGMLAAFMMTSAPTGWLKANGAAVALATYSALSAIYCGDANNPTALHGYRCTNPASPSSTRSTTGGYIVLPDFRGEFIRGLDDGRGVDSGRSAWAAQSHMFESHVHSFGGTVGVSFTAGSDTVYRPGSSTFNTSAPATGTTGAETRPRNLAPLICIKY